MSSELATIQVIRSKYPTPLGVKHARFLDEVCLALGAKLFEKNAGDHTTLPNGKNVSLDVIIYKNQWVDILGDAERDAVPAWSPNPNPTGVFIDPLPLSAFDGGDTGGGGDSGGGAGVSEADVRRIVKQMFSSASIHTADGVHVLCAEGGGGGDVNATRTSVGSWETVRIDPKG